jgi:hypothetical protein
MGGANPNIQATRVQSEQPDFRTFQNVLPADMRREDGSIKGSGFLGEYANRGAKEDYGKTSSEVSTGVEPERLGKNAPKPDAEGYVDVPTMIPTLSKNEIDYLLDTPLKSLNKNNPRLFGHIADKSAEYAKARLDQGKSQWASPNESPVAPPRFMARPTLQQQETAYGYPVMDLQDVGIDDSYFKNNPEVAGMAWGAGENGSDPASPRVIVPNPYNEYMADPKKRSGLLTIEAARHLMGEKEYKPQFEIPKEQEEWRKGLGAYATNDLAYKQSVISRIIGGDYVPNATIEQYEEAEKVREMLDSKKK